MKLSNNKRKIFKVIFIVVVLITLFALYKGIILSRDEVTFIYMGDSQVDINKGNSYAHWGNLLEKAYEETSNAEFFIIGGDLINDETDKKEWDNFFNAGSNVMKKIPLYPVTGNHTPGEAYSDLFDLPQNGPVNFKSKFYSFDQGNAHFIMADSNLMGTLDKKTEKEIYNWLKNDLMNSHKTWKILVMHHPMYSIGSAYKDQIRSETMQKNYLHLLEKEKVDLILCGHQHVYARTYPLKEGQKTSLNNGIIEIMGVSGDKYYSANKKNTISFLQEDISVFTSIIIKNKQISIFTKDADGKIIDQCNWVKK